MGTLPQIGAKLVLDGEQDFKKALTSINAEMKALESGLKLVEAQYKDNANSTEAIAAKTNILNQMMTAQKEKVKTLQDALANANTALAASKAKHEENTAALTASKTKYEAAAAEVKGYEQKIEGLKAAITGVTPETENATKKTAEYKHAIAVFGTELEKSKKALKETEEDVNKLQAAFQSSQNSLLSVTSNVSRWQTSLNGASVDVLELQSRLDEASSGVVEFDSKMKTLDSELKLVERQYKNNASSTEAITAKTAVLNQMMTVQQERVSTLRAEHIKANATLTESKKKQEENETALTASKTKYEAAEAEVKNYEQELEKLNTQYAALTPETDAAGAQTVKLMHDIAKMTEALEKSKAALSATETEVNSLQVALSGSQDDVHAAQNGVNRWQTALTGAAVDLRELQTRLDTVSNNGVADFNTGMNRMQQETVQTNSHIHTLAEGVTEAQSKLSGLNSIFAGTLGARIAGDALMYLGQQILEVTKQGIKLSSDLTEVHNVIDNVFTSMNDSVYAWAEKSAASFGISMLNAEKYAGQLGAMFNASGMTEQATYDLSTALVKMTGDMASLYNFDTAEMFEKIQSGLTGQVKPLRELGIDMTVANLNAYALATGVGKVYDEMSQAEKYQLRYDYLVQQASISQDDFTETINTFANQQRLAQLNTEDLSAKIGEALTPALNTGLHAFNEWATNGEATAGVMANLAVVAETVVNVLVKSSTFLLDHLEGVSYALAAIGAAKGMFAVERGLTVAVEAAKALKAGIIAATAAEEALTAAEVAAGAAAAANPIGLVMAGVAVAVIGAVAAFDAVTTSQRELEATAEASKKAFVDAKGAVDETTKKIEKNNETLKNLQAQWNSGFHTETLAEQLNSVKANTAELGAQLEIQKQALEVTQRKAEEDAVAVLNSKKSEDGFIKMQEAIDNYKTGLVTLTDLEKKRDDAYDAAKKAREAGDKDLAKVEEQNAATFAGQYEQAKTQQRAYKDNMILTAEAMNKATEGITGVTKAGAEATAQVDKYSVEVVELGNSWSDIPTNVSTTYKVNIVENIVGAMQNVSQNMVAFGEDLKKQAPTLQLNAYENALKVELEALDHNLALKKVSEEEYWSQKSELLEKNKNTESVLYFEQQDAVTAHYNKLNEEAESAAQKVAADNERAAKEAATAATKAAKEAYDELEKQYDRGEIDRKTFNNKYAALVKSWGNTQKDVAYDTAEKVEKINEDKAKEEFKALEEKYNDELITREEFNEEYAALLESWGGKCIDAEREAQKAITEIDKKEQQARLDNVEKSTEAAISVYEKQVEQINSKIDAMKSNIGSDFGDLFSVEKRADGKNYAEFMNGEAELTPAMKIAQKRNELEAYEKQLNALRERGVSKSIMDQFAGLGLKDGIALANTLAKATDSELDAMAREWEAYQEKVGKVATEPFAAELKSAQTQLMNNLKEVVTGDDFSAVATTGGVKMIAGLIAGMKEAAPTLDKAYSDLITALQNGTIADYDPETGLEEDEDGKEDEEPKARESKEEAKERERKEREAKEAARRASLRNAKDKTKDASGEKEFSMLKRGDQDPLIAKLQETYTSKEFKDTNIAGGKAVVDGMIDGIKANSKALGTGLVTELTTKLEESKELLDEAESSPKTLGLYMAQGIADGIAAGTHLITEVLNNTSDEMLKAIKKKFGIKSPSRVFRDEVGVHLATGLGEGFETQMQVVKNQMADSLNAADILNGVSRSALKAPAALAVASSSSAQSTNFTQNNYSPKALTPYEIRKNTQAMFNLHTLK